MKVRAFIIDQNSLEAKSKSGDSLDFTIEQIGISYYGDGGVHRDVIEWVESFPSIEFNLADELEEAWSRGHLVDCGRVSELVHLYPKLAPYTGAYTIISEI